MPMRLLITLLVLLLLSGSAVSQEKVPSDLIASYSFHFAWGGTQLTLNKDGTFKEESGSCTAVFTRSGPYSFSNNILRFTMTKYTTRDHGDDTKEVDLTKPKWRKKILDTDEPFKVEQYEMSVVRWGGRVYLMDVNLFGDFIDAINLGFEPRRVEGYRHYYGAVLLRIGDEKKDVTNGPSLPDEFLARLLRVPVMAVVLDVETVDKKTIATINRGTVDGLKAGVMLVPMADANDMFSFEGYRVLSVEQHTAKVEVSENVRIGDGLTTRLENVHWFE